MDLAPLLRCRPEETKTQEAAIISTRCITVCYCRLDRVAGAVVTYNAITVQVAQTADIRLSTQQRERYTAFDMFNRQ